MPISDSPYTNPDSLRLLYLNPRNALRALNEILGDQEQQQFASLPVGIPPSTGGNISGGGGIGIILPSYARALGSVLRGVFHSHI
jgi:hypothetical protein